VGRSNRRQRGGARARRSKAGKAEECFLCLIFGKGCGLRSGVAIAGRAKVPHNAFEAGAAGGKEAGQGAALEKAPARSRGVISAEGCNRPRAGEEWWLRSLLVDASAVTK
jgi:hypothetical protein